MLSHFDGFAECHEDISVIKSNLYSALNHIPDFYGQAHTVQIKSIEYDGYYRHGYLRPIIVEFHSHIDVMLILNGKRNLPKGVFVREYLPKELERQRRTMLQVYLKAKSMDEYHKKCRMDREKLIIKGKEYTVKNLDDLPSAELHPIKLCEKQEESVVAFFGKGSPLSNFHRCNINYDGYMFTSVEQILQSEKAELYEENQIQAKILMTE